MGGERARSEEPGATASPVRWRSEQSGAAENVDAAEDIEEALDEPVSASDDASDPMSGDDGVTTAGRRDALRRQAAQLGQRLQACHVWRHANAAAVLISRGTPLIRAPLVAESPWKASGRRAHPRTLNMTPTTSIFL